MLKTIIDNTNKFIASVPKSKRKSYGQFFTTGTTAQYMAGLFCFDHTKTELKILDAGAGTGILTAAVIDKLFNDGYKGNVCMTCYETDPNVLPVLTQNLELLKSEYRFSYEIKTDNYITSQRFAPDSLIQEDCCTYDYIIGNPPYLKIGKDDIEAKCMIDVCHGAPNMYFLFWAMGIYNLKENQEMVYIVPRSWTSGAYFKRFRSFLFSRCILTDIHLFESRDKVFDGESVLQETIIVKIKKTTVKPQYINITTSQTSDFRDIKEFKAPYQTVVSKNQFVYLITDNDEANVLNRINKLSCTLPDINLKMKTGLIVDFRTKEVLRDKMEDGAFPLLYSQHIRDGRVVWPIGKEGEVIKTEKKAYLQPNGNFLMVKRFTSKEEKRRLQCGIYLKKHYEKFTHISTQNKINFIECDSPCLTYGLYVLLNSSLYDNYYRILNGSTQVNSTEINMIPVPERKVIEEMGRELMHNELSTNNCNTIIDKWIN